jgi:hypothetical protein
MHVSDADLELFVFARLSADQTAAVQAHVADCATCRAKAADVEEFKRQLSELSARQAVYNGEEKRRETRVAPGDLGSMHLLHPLSMDRLGVRIVDVSQHGMKLRVRECLSSGMLVQIRVKDTFVLGDVRYCVRADDKFFYVGIHIQDVTE